MYFGLWNDLEFAAMNNYSFLLNDPNNQRFTAPCSYADYILDPANYMCDPCDPTWNPDWTMCSVNHEMVLGLPATAVFELVHTNIGPLKSIDLYYVRPPLSLIKMFSTFQDRLSQFVLSGDTSFVASLATIPNTRIDPVPPSWNQSEYVYSGGDPTCIRSTMTNFVQTSFAFDTSCISSDTPTILLTRCSALFALWATSQTNSSIDCNLCLTTTEYCILVLNVTTHVISKFSQDFQTKNTLSNIAIYEAYKIIADLGVSMIRFAVSLDDSSSILLRRQILGSTVQEWDFFGWLYAYEWVQGYREVVSFEGDAGVISIISDKYDPFITQAQELEVPRSACVILWTVTIFTSVVFGFVGALVVGFILLVRIRVVGRNFFQCNRVPGVVSLGRPLLTVRSVTAMILLSTSPVHFQTQLGYARFVMKPRSFVESMLAAGEATWLSFVLSDILLVTTHTAHFVPISTWLSWVIMVIVDVAMPPQVTASVNRECVIDFLGKHIDCSGGEIGYGGGQRMLFLALLQVISVFIGMLASKLWMSVRRSSATLLTGHMLLSSTAMSVLSKKTLPNGAHVLDRASCVMCGLITFCKSILDLKLWIILPEEDNSRSHADVKWRMKVFDPPPLGLPDDDGKPNAKDTRSQSVRFDRRIELRRRCLTFAGLLYMCATIFGRITYLTLTSTNMANDFWWANYNATREHVFVTQLYNTQLNFRPHHGAFR
ncbi:hypothetical protein AeRB84_002204 [Aphanomyces euteiches]|nr:hypothetical protein AeRB84_002204 [Aphanomyces euteiches]